MYPTRITRQFESGQKDNNRDGVERIKNLGPHLLLQAPGPFSDACSELSLKWDDSSARQYVMYLRASWRLWFKGLFTGRSLSWFRRGFSRRSTKESLSVPESCAIRYWTCRLCTDWASSSNSSSKQISCFSFHDFEEDDCRFTSLFISLPWRRIERRLDDFSWKISLLSE